MKQKMLNTWLLPFLILLLLIGRGAAQLYADENLNVLDKMYIQNYILEKVRSDYVDSINVATLFDGAIQGMIDKLDPHSSYMEPETANDFSERINGEFAGIGITFVIINNKITVMDLIEGGPSAAAGLKSRDKIVQIDGKDAIGIAQDSVKVRLRGTPGSQVTVLVERPGMQKPFSILIKRGIIEMNSVSHAYMLDKSTGYIALSRFSVKTPEDVVKALTMLKSKGMTRLVLDLRNNSGGLLDSAVNVVNLFIKQGKIVYTLGRKKSNDHEWKALGNAPFPDIPMIVMINHGSASASEIVAGALQDHDRALIVGQTSFGKGLVMNPYPLKMPDTNNPGAVKSLGTVILTTSRYYTPSGRLIQRPYDKGRDEYIKDGYDDKDMNASDSTRVGKPVFHTDLGRDVYGGGGISPDVILTPLKRLNELELALRNSNLYFEFADDYLLRNNDVPKDFTSFLTGYRISSNELENFRKFIELKGIHIDSLSHFNEDLKKLTDKYGISPENAAVISKTLNEGGGDPDKTLFERSIPTIERELKQEIARMVWGSEERYRVWHAADIELDGAIGSFDMANDLLTRRLALQKE
jgi:carboxyl-terminal processing protease